MINSELDYVVGQDFLGMVKKNIGVAITENELDVILKSRNRSVTVKKQLNSATRQVTAYYR